MQAEAVRQVPGFFGSNIFEQGFFRRLAPSLHRRLPCVPCAAVRTRGNPERGADGPIQEGRAQGGEGEARLRAPQGIKPGGKAEEVDGEAVEAWSGDFWRPRDEISDFRRFFVDAHRSLLDCL